MSARRYPELLKQAIELAENKFSATLVNVSKNILLLRKNTSNQDGRNYMTIAVSFRDMSFYWGNYDLSAEHAEGNFAQRVSESQFNPQSDID